MIKGNYLVRSYKGENYYLNLLDPDDISTVPPLYYGDGMYIEQKNRQINYFILHITDKCNMRCKYCFERGINLTGDLTITDIERLIKFINSNDNVAEKINIRFFGGEPLLKTEFISEAISLFERLIVNKTVKYNIFTNGTIVNDQVFKLLDQYPIILFISIDGTEKSHNRNRIMANYSSSHSIISRNIKTLISRYENRIITRSVIDPLNSDELLQNIDYIISLGVRQLSFTLPWGGCSGKQIAVESCRNNLFNIIDKFFEDFLERIKRHQFDSIGVHPFSTTFFSIINKDKFHLDSRACGAGFEALAIGTDGKIYPCHSFAYNKDYEIGDLKDGVVNLDNPIGNMTCDLIEQCSQCDIRYLCKIRCFADNLMTNGRIDKNVPLKCEAEKYIIDSICHLALKLKPLRKEKRLMNIIESKYQLKGYA